MAEISFSGKRELRWLQEGDCFITFVGADVAIADALWDEWLAGFIAAPGKVRLLSSWGDIQPTKEQWRRATRMMRDAKLKVAVLTESRPTSALAKAASWAGVDMQAFRWEQLYEASLWLELDGPQRMAVRASVTALRDRFGPVDGSTTAAPASASFSARPSITPSAPSRPTSGPSPSSRPVTSPSAPSRPTSGPSPSSRPVTSPSTPSRPSAKAPEPQRVAPARPSTTATTTSNTPMADAASWNLAQVRHTSEEIQAKLAVIKARLRNRTRA
jgi:hypothetical protein